MGLAPDPKYRSTIRPCTSHARVVGEGLHELAVAALGDQA